MMQTADLGNRHDAASEKRFDLPGAEFEPPIHLGKHVIPGSNQAEFER